VSLVEKEETVQVHFTLEGDGLRVPKKLTWMKSVYGFLRDKPCQLNDNRFIATHHTAFERESRALMNTWSHPLVVGTWGRGPPQPRLADARWPPVVGRRGGHHTTSWWLTSPTGEPRLHPPPPPSASAMFSLKKFLRSDQS